MVYWKTFNQVPGPEPTRCRDWDDGEGGLECHPNVLRALYTARPMLAQVEIGGRTARWVGDYITAESVKPIRVFKWTIDDSRTLAQFVFDIVIKQIKSSKILKKKDLDALADPLNSSELALEDALYEFYSYFPYEHQYDASHLRQLIYSYENLIKTEKEIEAQREAAEAAYAAIQVMLVFGRDIESTVIDWIKKRLEEKS